MSKTKFIGDRYNIEEDSDRVIQSYQWYKAMFLEDFAVDYNIKEKVLMLPGLQHKWLGFLFEHKRERELLKRSRENQLKELTEENISSGLTPKTQRALRMDDPIIKKIEEKINDCDAIIDFLENCYKNASNFGFTLKNMIELMKMEIGG